MSSSSSSLSSGVATADSRSASSSSAPVHLYRHALECIFAFASLDDLARISAVSRDWSSAVLSMPRIRATFIPTPGQVLLAASESKLSRHVIDVGDASGFSESSRTVSPYLDCTSISMASQRMPQLERLSVNVVFSFSDEADTALELPRRLLDLTLSVPNLLTDRSAACQSMLPSFRAAMTEIFFRFANCDNKAAPRVLRPATSPSLLHESAASDSAAASSVSSSSPHYPLKTMSRIDMRTYIFACGAGEASANDERITAILTKYAPAGWLNPEEELPLDGFLDFYRSACEDRPEAVWNDLVVHGFPRLDSGRVQPVLNAVGRCNDLTSLTLILTQPFVHPLRFKALAQIPTLRRLVIERYETMQLTDEQVNDLRALPHLDILDVSDVEDSLDRLLRQPHCLQWKQLARVTIQAATASSLLQLPSLTEIDAKLSKEALDCLPRLPNLAILRFQPLHIGDESTDLSPEQFVGALQGCSQLTRLTLDFDMLGDQHLREIMPCLPLLRSLHLTGMEALESLSFLQSSPALAHTLTELQLRHCNSIPASELDYVHALRALQSLHLYSSFLTPLDAATLALYTPPSALLPQLTEFVSA